MADTGISMPAGFGGLMRYNAEYKSKIMLDPKHVIIIIALAIIFVAALKIFWPVTG